MENSSLDGARVNRSNQKIKKKLIWNVKNKKKLNDSDKLDEIYNAAYMKVTGYKFIEDCSDMNKIRTGLFQYFNIAIV